MRRSVLVGLVVASAALGFVPSTNAAPPTIEFRSRELQEGRSFLKTQTSVPSVSEAAGQLTYGYPIDVPAGRGITPKIELQYTSGARQSEFGWGWELTLPTIARTQRFGAVDYTSDLFTYREGREMHELVPTGVTTPQGGVEYKERVEQTFRRYLFYPSANQWRVLTINGVRYELGTANSSRRGKNPNLGQQATAEWLVARIIDTNNNYALYEYGPGSTRSARIARIRYNGNAGTGISPTWTVTFNWSTNFNAKAVGFRSGFERRFGADRLDSIVVSIPPHVASGPAVVPSSSPVSRTYRFSYSDVTAPSDAIFYLLSAQADTMPAVTFDYSNPAHDAPNDFERLIDTTGQGYPGHLGFTTSKSGMSLTRSAFVDATRDARPDLVDTNAPGTDVWTIYKNHDSYLNREYWNAPLDLTDTAMPDNHALRVEKDLDTYQEFFDLDGDGYPDLLWLIGAASGVAIKYCPGNGHGFDACQVYGNAIPNQQALRDQESPSSGTTITDLDFADMNGDGLVDILSVKNGVLAVYRNLGRGPGFAQTPELSKMIPCPWTLVPSCLRMTQTVVVPGGNRRQLADLRDVNGDGLVDYVFNDFTTNELKIAFGDGHTFRPWVATGRYFSLGIGNQSAAGDYAAVDDMIDMNGDGLLDAVHMDIGASTYSVWFNDGGVWDATPHVHQASASTAGHYSASMTAQTVSKVSGEEGVATTARLLDFDGDGNVDFVSAPFNPLFPFSIRVGQANYRAPRLMIAAQSLSGHHSLSVDWAAANSEGESDWQPMNLITGGPSPVHVPLYVTRQIEPLYNGQPNRETTTITHYKFDGAEFDPLEREFAGFFIVTATGPSWGVTTQTNYGTSLAQRGLVLASRSNNNSAQGIGERLVNVYSYVPLPGGRTFAQLDTSETGPPPTPELPVATALTKYTGYNAFGQATEWIQYGRQLDDTDDYINTRTYVSRVDDDFMLSLVAEEKRQKGTTLSSAPVRTRNYYDNPNVFGLAPTKGNLVKTARDVDGNGTWVSGQELYDSNGNVYQRVDEMGLATTYAYDASYARFPVIETTPVGTSYRSFHALTASRADDCGPQYSGGSYRCSRTEVDAFGRVTATWVPVLVGSTYNVAQLTSVVYDDYAYPLAVTVTKRGIAHTTEYRDGFGNAVQLRVEDDAGLGYHVFDRRFDANGHPIRVEQPYYASGAAYAVVPATGEAWLYDYDPIHDAIERVTYPRDPGSVAPPAVSSRVVRADRTVVVDEDGRETDYIQDTYRRTTRVQRYDGTAHNDTAFTYDVHGQVESVTDAVGNVMTYRRDLLGRVRQMTPPGLGSYTYSYNARGQVVSTLDQRGVVVAYGYDPKGRLSTIMSTGGGSQVRAINATLTYYDAATDPKQLGWLKSESSDNITQLYSYDAEQSLALHQVTAFGFSGAMSFTYDIGKRLRTVTYPDGLTTYYYYYPSDDLHSIVGGGATTSPFHGFEFAALKYDAAGRVNQVTNDGGLGETYGYDARGRRTSVFSTNSSVRMAGPLVDDVVQLSDAGDVLSLTRRGLHAGGMPRPTPDVFSITNDPFHQVTQVDLNGQLAAHYAYDAAGRLTTFNETGTPAPSTSTYEYDRLKQPTTDASTRTWTYDAAGEVTIDEEDLLGTHPVRAHSWDALERYARTLIFDGTKTEYFYTPSGKLARVIAPSELATTADNLYIGAWARLDTTTGVWTDRITANGNVYAERTGATVEIPHRTIQNTIAAVSDASGHIVRQEEFSPFGLRTAGTAAGRFEEHFQGVRSDELVVAGGRAYDTHAGSWLARDPAHRDPAALVEDVRLVNAYAFDNSNPYRYRDPSGAQVETESEPPAEPPAEEENCSGCRPRLRGNRPQDEEEMDEVVRENRERERDPRANWVRPARDPRTGEELDTMGDPMVGGPGGGTYRWFRDTTRLDPYRWIELGVTGPNGQGGGLVDLAKMRAELNMGSEGTLARLDLGNGSVFFGINGHGQTTVLRVSAQSIGHAETDAFNQAALAGATATHATLYVDRPLCTGCGFNGAVRSMGAQIGVETIEVVTWGGTQMMYPRE